MLTPAPQGPSPIEPFTNAHPAHSSMNLHAWNVTTPRALDADQTTYFTMGCACQCAQPNTISLQKRAGSVWPLAYSAVHLLNVCPASALTSTAMAPASSSAPSARSASSTSQPKYCRVFPAKPPASPAKITPPTTALYVSMGTSCMHPTTPACLRVQQSHQ